MEEKIISVCLSLEQWNRIISRLLKQSLPPETPVMIAVDDADEKIIVTVLMDN